MWKVSGLAKDPEYQLMAISGIYNIGKIVGFIVS